MSQDGSVKKVLDDRQIDKSLLGIDIGNVCSPFFIRSFGFEVLPQEIGVSMDISILFLYEPLRVPFPRYRANIELSHQPQDCFVIDFDAVFSFNPDLYPSVAIGFPGYFIGLAHQLHAFLVRIWMVHSLCPSIIC